MNPKTPATPLQYISDHREQILEELIAWCKIPSISSLGDYQPDIQAAAGFGAQLLRSAGLKNVAILPTSGHPVVYGEWLEAGKNAPTILLYGHYDVQPALEPDLWESPPFDPVVKDEHLFARGSSDMKGQTLAEIKAIQAVLKTEGKLPVNIKFIIEGEEEIGSRNLRAFIQRHKEKLACDYAFNPDAGMCAIGQPSITYSLRGGVRIDLTVYGPHTDVHSGVFGGAIHNPALALSDLIAGMYDEVGRVTLPGFYDGVQPLEKDERTLLARLPVNDDFFISSTKVPALWGDPDFTAYERTAARPSLEVLALHAGLSGEGVLNIVPAKASAALSMRLVPDQDPQHCYQGLLRYLEQKAPPTIRWDAKYIAGGRGVLVSRQSPAVQALYRALEATWQAEPLFSRQGGGIPVVGQLQQELGIDSILTGFGLPTDNIHGPNEHLHLPTWYLGMQAIVRFLYEA